MAAEDHGQNLRPPQRPGRSETGRDDWHGDDREAGRFGRARQYDPRHSGRRGRAGQGLRTRRAQVLRLGADVRRLSRPRPGARRAFLFPCAALAAGRNQEPAADRAAQAQDGQRLQRLERDGTARRARLDGGTGRTRRRDHHRDGGDDPLRLHDRLLRRHAYGGFPGDRSLPAAQGVRGVPDRPADHDQRCSPISRSRPRRRSR